MDAATLDKFVKVRNDTISGAFAGVVGTVLGHPLDIVKVRVQVARAAAAASGSQTFQSRGIVSHLVEIARREGVLALYKGVLSPVVALTILNTISFVLYGKAKRYCESQNLPIYFCCFVGGFFSGLSLSFISTPFEMVKIQMQLDNIREKKFRHSTQCSRYLYRTYGIPAFYKGFCVNTVRETIYSAVYFTVYEFAKVQFMRSSNQSSLSIMIAGGLAGICAWCCSFPCDVVKSIIQSEVTQKTRTLDVARATYAKLGIRGFFTGIYPSVVRAFFVSGSRFSAFEFAQLMLHRFSDRETAKESRS